jgi:hypothetical protein
LGGAQATVDRDGRKCFVNYHPAVRYYRQDLAAKIKEDFSHLHKVLHTL